MTELNVGVLATGLGWLGLAWSPQGLHRSVLFAEEAEDAWEALRAAAGPDCQRGNVPAAIAEAVRDWERGRTGALSRVVVAREVLSPGGFARRAWSVLASIPPGEVRSYAWLARAAGRPGAARAAGQACAKNPVPLFLPCHRVVRSDGTLGGFGGGGAREALKTRMLAVEGVALAGGKVPARYRGGNGL